MGPSARPGLRSPRLNWDVNQARKTPLRGEAGAGEKR